MKEEEGLTELEKSMRKQLDSHEFEFKDTYWKQYETQYGNGKSNRKTILLLTLLLITVTSSAWWLAIHFFNTNKVQPTSVLSTLNPETKNDKPYLLADSKPIALKNTNEQQFSNIKPVRSSLSIAKVNVSNTNQNVIKTSLNNSVIITNTIDTANVNNTIDESHPMTLEEKSNNPIQTIVLNELVTLYPQKTGSINIIIPKINSTLEPVKVLLALQRQKQQQFLYIHSGITFFNQKSLTSSASWEGGLNFVKFFNSRLMTSFGVSYCGIQQQLPTRTFTSTTYSFGSTQFKTSIDVNSLNYVCLPFNIGIEFINKHSIQFGATYWRLLNGLIGTKQINETDPPTSSTKHELGIPNGISNSDISVHIGYRYISASHFIFDISYQKGLKDITSNIVYSSQNKDVNNGIILSIGYKLWR